MTALSLSFSFTPADSTVPRNIRVSFETQEDERRPLRVTIDWGDGHPDRIPFPGLPLSGLELAARYVSLRILGRVEHWGGGTIHPEVESPHPLATAGEEGRTAMERHLEYWPPGATQSLPIRVRIGGVVPYSTNAWQSTLTIEGFPDEPTYSKPMIGSDPLEALSYALSVAPLLLRLMGARGGRVTHNGRGDLRFPSMSSSPSQNWQFTPTTGGEPRKLWIRLGLPERIEDRWSVFLECTDCDTWETAERHIEADTWPEAIEQAGAAVPGLLRDVADKLGGGTLEELHRSPASGIGDGAE